MSTETDSSEEDELDTSLLPKDEENLTEHVVPPESPFFFIPQVKLHDGDGSHRKRVLVLCTGGTLTSKILLQVVFCANATGLYLTSVYCIDTQCRPTPSWEERCLPSPELSPTS